VFVIAIEHRPGRGSSRISGSTSSGGGGGGFLDQQCAEIGGADGAKLVVFFLFLLMNWVGPSSA
jgi:hypothetical protein